MRLLRKMIAHCRMLRFLRWGGGDSPKPPLGPFGIYMWAPAAGSTTTIIPAQKIGTWGRGQSRSHAYQRLCLFELLSLMPTRRFPQPWTVEDNATVFQSPLRFRSCMNFANAFTSNILMASRGRRPGLASFGGIKSID